MASFTAHHVHMAVYQVRQPESISHAHETYTEDKKEFIKSAEQSNKIHNVKVRNNVKV